MRKKYNIALNDVDYAVVRHEVINGVKNKVWMCPFYRKWNGMLYGCYCVKAHKKFPSYARTSVLG